ncbi:acyltransferase-like protein At1g54570, chloroplastic isoform X2 [Punica granatum]|uniref:Acyltransferase-like protein At1g54570, chloroplastic isoform X2 n=1 Tax=Punica granatum TaxID=22663 RepID=A0A6P8DGX2_PUNGR|nr:acyltransferase-like protein At1g54570, chloroplastic isoform X2 [Punica granatum]
MASSFANFLVSPPLVPGSELVRPRFRVLARNAPGGADQAVSSLEPVALNGTPPAPTPVAHKEERSFESVVGGNGRFGLAFEVEEEKRKEQPRRFDDGMGVDKLEILWDDGYGSVTIKDYLDASKEILKPDGGPPRWFCPVECGQPLKDSPVLLFLPGLDGMGMGLILHHKALGRVFEVRCLHIPVQDRTPFEGLVKLVEETVRLEHAISPKKPIYLVGDSFGGCLALAIAARNPSIDLVVILANPGDPMKMAMVNIDNKIPPRLQLEQLSGNLTALLPRLSTLIDIIPKGTLLWKLKLLKSAASYANSRLHAIRAEVLVLASGKDNMIPSREEGQRLVKSIRNCRVRHFKDNGHTLLMEEGINLLTVIKGTCTYRRSRRHDYISDFLPPSMWEFKTGFEQIIGLFRYACSSILYSTLEDGTIVKGLSGVPSKGPVLLVGYHMLMGFELYSLVEEFLREKNVLVRGVAHPELFMGSMESPTSEFSLPDWLKVFGAVPVTASSLYKLLATNSHALLYPGGSREALHYKGEEYKVIWPDQPEFVRMAARFGATIVPFGAIGEDDIVEYVLDYNDMMKIPFLNDYIRELTQKTIRVRDSGSGEVANDQLFLPGILPKVPGRMYYLFGKPIEIRGREEILMDKKNASELYFQIKSEVERSMAYLIKKREEDPYRNIFDRVTYRVLHSPSNEIPGFKP